MRPLIYAKIGRSIDAIFLSYISDEMGLIISLLRVGFAISRRFRPRRRLSACCVYYFTDFLSFVYFALIHALLITDFSYFAADYSMLPRRAISTSFAFRREILLGDKPPPLFACQLFSIFSP